MYWPVSFLPLDFIDRDMKGAVCTPTHGKSFIDPKLCGGDRLSLRKRSEIEAELLPVRPRLEQILLLLHCVHKDREGVKQSVCRASVKTLEMKKICRRGDWQEKMGNRKGKISSGSD